MQQDIKKTIQRASLLLIASTLLSRVVGFLREWILAQTIGANATTDVYLASFTIPDFMNYLMAAGALSISFIPILNEYLASDRHEVAKLVFRSISTRMVGILVLLVIVAEYFAPSLARIVAPGFSSVQFEMLTSLIRIILPAQIFFYWGGFAISVQHAHGAFLMSALAPVVYNTSIIVCGVLLHPSHGVAGFSYGVLFGSVISHGFLQWLALRRLGYSCLPSLRFDAEIASAFKRYLWLTLPIAIGFSIVVVDEWLSKYFASRLGERAITWLSYARTEMRIPVAVIGQVAGIASFPFLSRMWAKGDFDGYGRTLLREISKIWAAGPLAAILLVNHALPITHFIYGSGRLTHEDLLATSDALRMMGLGVFFWILQVLLARGFYASERNWLPSVSGTLLCLLMIPIYPWLGDRYGHRGLALAGTIGITTYSLLLAIWLRAHIRRHAPALDSSSFRVFWVSWTAVLIGMGALSHLVAKLGIYRDTRLSGLAEVLVASAVLGGVALLLLRKVFARFTDGPLY